MSVVFKSPPYLTPPLRFQSTVELVLEIVFVIVEVVLLGIDSAYSVCVSAAFPAPFQLPSHSDVDVLLVREVVPVLLNVLARYLLWVSNGVP